MNQLKTIKMAILETKIKNVNEFFQEISFKKEEYSYPYLKVVIQMQILLSFYHQFSSLV